MQEFMGVILDTTKGLHTKKKNKQKIVYSDTIYTFDIETTSLFFLDGKWTVFDYDRPKEDYSHQDNEIMAVPYIWQFGIEDKVYYGRDFMEFESILLQLSDESMRKIIWVHNLSFELEFLQNIFDKYTIIDMCARDIRKPISFVIEELNIEFRCSYMLTNLSLEKASEEYTNVRKLHTLNYDNKVRLECSTLTQEELEYCEYDCICLYHIIEYYKKRYGGHLCSIPLTATGEVRKALQQRVGFYYIKKQWELVPTSDMYLKMMWTFQGGYTHANVLNSGRLFSLYDLRANNYLVKSKDISSSYPTVMLLEKFPKSRFREVDRQTYMERIDNDNYCFILRVRLHGVKSRFYNNYISYNKLLDKGEKLSDDIKEKHLIYDNGRVQQIDVCEMYITNIDMKIIERNYDIVAIDYLEIYCADADYLDINVILFILELYNNKTTLKGIEGKEDMYKKAKAFINSLYGMSVTNALKNSAKYDGEWYRESLTDKFVNDVLDQTKKSYSTLFYYAVGLFVTSFARRNLLYDTVFSSKEFDRHVIYMDTDSIKYYGDYEYIFEEYNKQIVAKYNKVCKRFSQLNVEMFQPKDKKGIKHPIGFFTDDGDYTEFITFGAKKYCYREDGVLHITVSGVSKKGVSALNDDIHNFKVGFEWGYNDAHKLAHYYNDNQPLDTITDYEGNEWTNKYKHGLILQPTTYKLGITDIYEAMLEWYDEREWRK